MINLYQNHPIIHIIITLVVLSLICIQLFKFILYLQYSSKPKLKKSSLYKDCKEELNKYKKEVNKEWKIEITILSTLIVICLVALLIMPNNFKDLNIKLNGNNPLIYMVIYIGVVFTNSLLLWKIRLFLPKKEKAIENYFNVNFKYVDKEYDVDNYIDIYNKAENNLEQKCLDVYQKIKTDILLTNNIYNIEKDDFNELLILLKLSFTEDVKMELADYIYHIQKKYNHLLVTL